MKNIGRRICYLLLIGGFLLLLVGCGDAEESENVEKAENVEKTAAFSRQGANNVLMGGLSVEHGGTIYYIGQREREGAAVYAMDVSGENERMIYAPANDDDVLLYLHYDDGILYFYEGIFNGCYDAVESYIRALNLETGSLETVYKTTNGLSFLYLYRDRFYFAESRDEDKPHRTESDWMYPYDILSLDVDCRNIDVQGGNEGKTVFGDGFSTVGNKEVRQVTPCVDDEFFIYKDMIYYGNQHCDLFGNDKEEILPEDDWCGLLLIYRDKLYYLEDRSLMSADLNGENPQQVVETEGFAGLANAVGDKLYLISGEFVHSRGATPPLYTVALDDAGNGTLIAEEPAPGLGCITENWHFYGISDTRGGWLLYKEPWNK